MVLADPHLFKSGYVITYELSCHAFQFIVSEPQVKVGVTCLSSQDYNPVRSFRRVAVRAAENLSDVAEEPSSRDIVIYFDDDVPVVPK